MVVVGGQAIIPGNAINNNLAEGILLSGSNAFDNHVASNTIDNNLDRGIMILNANQNVIGAEGPGPTFLSNFANEISGNAVSGINLKGTSASNVIRGNIIGLERQLDKDGLSDVRANGAGIEFGDAEDPVGRGGATSNKIGGTTPGEANIISGNRTYGVFLQGRNTTDNTITGNIIGTNLKNQLGLGNEEAGIIVAGARGNFIGQPTSDPGSGPGNVISGNDKYGIFLVADSRNNEIQGNLIGTTRSGTFALPNEKYGIFVKNSNDTIGGDGAGSGNIISGNTEAGIQVENGTPTIQGNVIGLGKTGTPIANLNGIVVSTDAPTALIGGPTSDYGEGAGNIIAGNTEFGIKLIGANSTTIQGNAIGRKASGIRETNGLGGISVQTGSRGNDIIGNDITGDSGPGITVTNSTATDISGNLIRNNGTIGISVKDDSRGNAIEGNVISGNRLQGIFLASPENTVQENTVGESNARPGLVGNGGSGIVISGVSGNDNIIRNNTIVGNKRNGLLIDGQAEGNTVVGNTIGGPGRLANKEDGIRVVDSSNNMIGGTKARFANVISFNGMNGIRITRTKFASQGNDIIGNSISNNKGDGVSIDGGAMTTVGDVNGATHNVITGNAGNGVSVTGPSGGTVIVNNYIGVAKDGTTPAVNKGTALVVQNVPINNPADRIKISGNKIFGLVTDKNSKIVSITRILVTVKNGARGILQNNRVKGFDKTGAEVKDKDGAVGVLFDQSGDWLVQGNEVTNTVAILPGSTNTDDLTNTIGNDRVEGGLLRGFATVVGDVQVDSGRFAPGDEGVAGTFTIQGDYDQPGGVLEFDASNSGSDLVVVTGDVVLVGGISFNALTSLPNQPIEVIDNQGPNPVTGFFAGLPEGTKVSLGGQDFVITYKGGDGNDVVLNPVSSILSVAANNASVTVPENTVATNNGTWSSQDPAMTLSASFGTVTKNANNTWSWSKVGDESNNQTVTITATNTDGSTATAAFQVSYTDVAPTVSADNATVNASTGSNATNTGKFSDYDDNVTSITASTGTVQPITPGTSGTWSWSGAAQSASYTVTITATNADGSKSTTTFTVSSSSTPPTVSVNSPSVSSPENASATDAGTWSGTGVTLSASSGTVTQNNNNGTWSWSGTGDENTPYTVTITATGSGGPSATTSFNVTFTDVTPTVLSLAKTSITTPENVAATNSGAFSDYDDSLTITASQGTLVDNGNGTWSWSQTGDETNNGTVTVTATNADGKTVTSTFTVTFTDVSPTVVSLAQSSITTPENVAATNSGSFSDYDDALTITASQGTLTDNHDGTWSWTQTGDETNNGTVTVTATNADGATATSTFTVTFTDVAPTQTSLAKTSITTPENVAATNSGSFSDYDDTLTITASQGTLTDNGNGTWSWSQTGDESNNGMVTVTAKNADGATATSTFTVTFTDVAPTAVSLAKSSITTPENVAATNSGSFSDYDDTLTVKADKGTLTDNGGGSWSWTQTGDETNNGTATVTATNADGATATSTFTVTYTDVAPTVTANQPTITGVPENSQATNSGTFSDYDDNVTISSSVGTVTQTSGKSGTWTWTGNGDENSPYTVTITATNADGAKSTTTFNVSFTDVAPTVTANSASVSASENSSATNSGSFSDYDDSVTLSASTGTVTQTSGTAGTWTWTGSGDESTPYTVTITATNADGSKATTTFNVSFTDVAPTVTANSPSVTATENTSATNSGTFNDFDDAVTITASTGTVTQTAGKSGTWSWSGSGDENAPYTVTITATNADGAKATTTFNVAFTDASLSAGTINASGGVAGTTPTSLSATFTDANTAAPTSDFSGTITWGDGNSTLFTSANVTGSGGSYTITSSHQYGTSGSFNISITIKDAGGSSTADTGSTTVAPSTVATHFVVVATTPIAAGASDMFTVAAETASGTIDTSYTGTVHFTSTDSAATLPSDMTITNGQGIFIATFRTPGTQTITATDAVHSLTGTSNPITVTSPAGQVTGFAILIAPNMAPGQPVPVGPFNFEVAAVNSQNQIVTSYTGTILLTGADILMPASYQFTSADQGAHTFIATVGSAGPHTITATDASNSAITGSANFLAISTSGPSSFAATTNLTPSTTTSGSLSTPTTASTWPLIQQLGKNEHWGFDLSPTQDSYRSFQFDAERLAGYFSNNAKFDDQTLLQNLLDRLKKKDAAQEPLGHFDIG